MNHVFLIVVLICLMLPVVLYLLSTFFSDNNYLSELSDMPFECGFEPISNSRVPFSMQFFTVTIVFLIFDLEVVIYMPMVFSNEGMWMSSFMITLITFILLMGLVIEWYEGSLDWSI